MRSSEFEYTLPPGLIAQVPAAERSGAKLLVVERSSGALRHETFDRLPLLLRPDDLVVLNESKVLPARIRLRKAASGGAVEALLLRPAGEPRAWEALLRPASRLRPGHTLLPARAGAAGTVTVGERSAAGTWLLRFSPEADAAALGEPPLPPYIRRTAGDDPAPDRERYQTVYARVPGSVAAPTAGLHFDETGLAALAARGIETARIALHVGPGTFRPLAGETTEEHVMHAEAYTVAAGEAARIAGAIRAGRRLVAVGTTSVRTLEAEAGRLTAPAPRPAAELSGATSLFITPGFRFALTGALLTNFHLPRSTPYVLVCAFAGIELARAAYDEAIARHYRFLSYGDCMLIL